MIPFGVTPRVRADALLARDWDVVVVGAGIGGLMCAALLATRAKMRVLVLERHYEIGGLTQTFRRRRYAWEVGVHYVGDVGAGMPARMLDVACGGRVSWARMPVAHDRLIAPGIDLRMGGDRAALRGQWLSVARGEERAVDRVLDAVYECARAAPRQMVSRLRPGGPAHAPFLAYSDRTAAEVLADAGASPTLAMLAGYTWTDYGSPPEEASFAALAVITAHYLDGAFYPVGGGGVLARTMTETIARAGGAVVVRAEVERANVKDGRAVGVTLTDGTKIDADVVVSDVGARGTFDWLAPDADASARMHAIGPSASHLGVYVGLARSPSECGLDGANLFITQDAPGQPRRDWQHFARGDEPPADLFVSTVCASDPTFATRFPGRSVLSMASRIGISAFDRWRQKPQAHRDPSYGALKERLAASMIDVARRHLPQLGEIDALEVSTPLSTRHFTNHASGEIYGLAPTPKRFREGPGPHTSTRGLFLTGQDIWTGGIVGSAFGGLLSACAITKRDLFAELALR